MNSEMWFFPRNSPIVVLAIIAGVIVMFAFDVDEIAYVIGALAAGYLLLGVLFDLYEGRKK